MGERRGDAATEPADDERTRRRSAGGENRLRAAPAVLVAAVAYALLPETLLFAPRFVIPVLELALLVALVATNPYRMVRRTRWSRAVSIALAGVVVGTNLVGLGMLVFNLTKPDTSGGSLLLCAVQ